MTFPVVLRHSKYLLGNVSWRAVEEFFGITERLRRRITNEPGYPYSQETAEKVLPKYRDMLREQKRLPDYIWLWREDLIELKKRPGSGNLKRHLTQMEGFLGWSRPSENPAQDLLVCYVKQLINLTKALQGGTASKWWSRSDCLKEAELDGDRGMELLKKCDAAVLTSDERKSVEWLRPVIFLNWIQSIVERQKLGYSRTREEVCDLLRKHRVLEIIQEALKDKDNHYFWQLAYNGVELASMLEEAAIALQFYMHLVALDPGFTSFDYSPGEAPALSKESGMVFFCQTFAHLHKPIENN